jgi:quercetin dioxygenase-like cupin family protein
LSEHTASQTAIIHVLSGEGTLTLDDDVKELRPGTWVRMPAGLKHSLTATTPLKMTLLLVKS